MLTLLGVFAGFVCIRWVGDEESILLVASGMLLGYEEGVKIPEASLDKAEKSVN